MDVSDVVHAKIHQDKGESGAITCMENAGRTLLQAFLLVGDNLGLLSGTATEGCRCWDNFDELDSTKLLVKVFG